MPSGLPPKKQKQQKKDTTTSSLHTSRNHTPSGLQGQKYIENKQYWDGTGPIFLFIGAEVGAGSLLYRKGDELPHGRKAKVT